MKPNESFRDRIMSVADALRVLALFADAEGVVKVEDKLGGAGHEARLAAAKVPKDTTPIDSAVQYVMDSPAAVFAVNVTIMGTRGRAKYPVPDRMVVACYPKAAVLAGVQDFGPTFGIHTNCVTFHRVGAREATQTFGLPLCAVECPFALKDIPADPNPKRAATPYAAFWEKHISTTFHGHNVANLNNSRYDMRLEFVNND